MTNPEDPIFYAYIILDPRFKGTFIYDEGNLVLSYLPIYGGKGCDGRCDVHTKEAINTENESDKLNLLREIIEEGFEPKIVKVLVNVTEKEAFDKERYVIRVVGRADKGLGTLLNKTDGGDGFSGFIRTEEHQNKIAESNRGQKRTDEQKQRMRDSQIQYFSDERNRERLSIQMNEYYSSGEGDKTKEQISSTLISFYDTEEGQKFKEHLSSINSGENNPRHGIKQTDETIKKRKDTRNKNGYWQKDREELSESFSNGQKKRFSCPEERRKASERVKGKRWYNNGKQQGQHHPDKRPDGWELGRLR